MQVALPPLRERKEDIPELAHHFLARFATVMGRNVRGIAPGALDQLMAHAWSGNVRELEHVIQRAVALCDDETINGFVFAPKVSGAIQDQQAGQNSCVSIPDRHDCR